MSLNHSWTFSKETSPVLVTELTDWTHTETTHSTSDNVFSIFSEKALFVPRVNAVSFNC